MQKIIATKRIAETKFINLVEDVYTDNDGKEHRWVKAQRPNGQHAAVIVPMLRINSTPYLIVTKEFRVPLNGYEFGFPAGLIDPGENPTSTAVRELREETGYKVDKILEVSPLVFNSPGLTDEGVYLVYVEVSQKPEETNLQGSEEIVTYIMGQEGIKTLLDDSSKLFGAKAWLIFKQFVKHGEVI